MSRGGQDGEHQEQRFTEFVDPVDGVRWRVDMGFVSSDWTCTWGAGCQGMLDEPAESLQQGCCSVGAELLDEDEARRVAALGLTLDPDRFQFHETAMADGVFKDQTQRATRVVDGACIFLNRPGFSGGAGCALHLGAVDDGEAPMDWKPAICWQLPLKVEPDQHDPNLRTLRRWTRSDWGDGGQAMAWCCTESDHRDPSLPSAYVEEQPVAESLFDEIVGLVGPEVAVEIRSRAGGEIPLTD
jgi:hypothetical protein